MENGNLSLVHKPIVLGYLILHENFSSIIVKASFRFGLVWLRFNLFRFYFFRFGLAWLSLVYKSMGLGILSLYAKNHLNWT